MTNEIAQAAVARWTDPARRPLFKGKLIDSDGCCCAQGDVLRCDLGWTDKQLRYAEQAAVDKLIAKTLGISVAHSVLLRQINDQNDGCPQDVLTAPEKILGQKAQEVLAFWLHLDSLTPAQWAAARDATRDAATWAAARDATRDAAARAAARDATRDAAARDATRDAATWAAARDATGVAATWAAAWAAARDAAARDATRDATVYAMYEIMGADELEKAGHKPFFLPVFGWPVMPRPDVDEKSSPDVYEAG